MPQIYRTVITVKLRPMDTGRLWHQDNLIIKRQLNLYYHNLSIIYMFNPRKKHNLNANSELMSIYILTKIRYRTTNDTLMLLSPWDKSGMDMWQWHFINAIICAFYYFVSISYHSLGGTTPHHMLLHSHVTEGIRSSPVDWHCAAFSRHRTTGNLWPCGKTAAERSSQPYSKHDTL